MDLKAKVVKALIFYICYLIVNGIIFSKLYLNAKDLEFKKKISFYDRLIGNAVFLIFSYWIWQGYVENSFLLTMSFIYIAVIIAFTFISKKFKILSDYF